MPKITKVELLKRLEQNSQNYASEFKYREEKHAKEIAKLKYELEDRRTVQVAQILQSMSNMMEAACRVVLSLHRNL